MDDMKQRILLDFKCPKSCQATRYSSQKVKYHRIGAFTWDEFDYILAMI
jgi:hypothetical protein